MPRACRSYHLLAIDPSQRPLVDGGRVSAEAVVEAVLGRVIRGHAWEFLLDALEDAYGRRVRFNHHVQLGEDQSVLEIHILECPSIYTIREKTLQKYIFFVSKCNLLGWQKLQTIFVYLNNFPHTNFFLKMYYLRSSNKVQSTVIFSRKQKLPQRHTLFVI